MPGRRGIDHDLVVRVFGREPLDLEEARQFVDALVPRLRIESTSSSDVTCVLFGTVRASTTE